MIVEFLCNHGCLCYTGWRANSRFLSLGWCHSFCTMAFHCRWSQEPLFEGTLIQPFLFSSSSWFSSKCVKGYGGLMVFQEDAFFFLLIFLLLLFFFSKTIVAVLYSLLVYIVHVGVYIVHIISCICCPYFWHEFYILFRVNIYLLLIVSPFILLSLLGYLHS